MMRGLALITVMLAAAACTSKTAPDDASAPATTPASTHRPAAHHSSTIAFGSASRPAPASTAPASTAPAESPDAVASAQSVFAAMTERERIGQLLMVDCPSTGVAAATQDAITRYHVGSVILDVTNSLGVTAMHAVTSRLRALAPKNAGLFISTDQEGGLVQRLQGPGFTRIVSAVDQGRIDPATLQGYAQGWGEQLRAAGVNVNLAPVLDTVPAGFGSNPPIGDLDREFGHTPGTVSSHGLAVLRGETAAGVDVTVKHFPGLGRVRGNTDTTAGVEDTVTTRTDPYLAPFRAAVQAGTPFVMMSTAIYTRIDAHHIAAFSPTIVTGMLRGDLGFRGLVISDDLGGAKQVSGVSVGRRAIDFVGAGGDIVLTVNANDAAAMTSALMTEATKYASFKKKVDAAALLVLQYKAKRGLLH